MIDCKAEASNSTRMAVATIHSIYGDSKTVRIGDFPDMGARQ